MHGRPHSPGPMGRGTGPGAAMNLITAPVRITKRIPRRSLFPLPSVGAYSFPRISIQRRYKVHGPGLLHGGLTRRCRHYRAVAIQGRRPHKATPIVPSGSRAIGAPASNLTGSPYVRDTGFQRDFRSSFFGPGHSASRPSFFLPPASVLARHAIVIYATHRVRESPFSHTNTKGGSRDEAP